MFYGLLQLLALQEVMCYGLLKLLALLEEMFYGLLQLLALQEVMCYKNVNICYVIAYESFCPLWYRYLLSPVKKLDHYSLHNITRDHRKIICSLAMKVVEGDHGTFPLAILGAGDHRTFPLTMRSNFLTGDNK
jgi:succinate-acetate transporter protein